VQVWGDVCAGYRSSAAADEWLSETLGQVVHLVYMPDSVQRAADPRYAPAGQYVSYADGFPFLILGEATLADLNARLESPLPMDRFRPNLVFSGGQPYEEDAWADFKVGSLSFRGVKPCGRCAITTIDQDKGLRGVEPIRTLATYRMRENSIKFGQNAIFLGSGGQIKLGDAVVPIQISVS
jgi:uncharacterized protein